MIVPLIQIRKNILSIISYPKAAFLEITLTILNNFTFVFLVWFLIFSKFENVSGWGFSEAMLLIGSAMLGFGIVMFFFGGLSNFEKITDGEFDIYFLRPKSIFLQYASDSMELSTLGDVFSGLLILMLSGYGLAEVLFVLSIFCLVFVLFLTVVSGIALIVNAVNPLFLEEMSWMPVNVSTWPSFTLPEILKVILVFLLPGMLMGIIPVEFVAKGEYLGLLVSGILFYCLLAFVLWRTGLKKYTGLSGSGWMSR
ncbi:MAG: hypothetical protein GXO63_01975 [Candidatus Micrarchaeota archaeon]|nr:hypothetical protein [Candidatus Micrarchaeota archaeon]